MFPGFVLPGLNEIELAISRQESKLETYHESFKAIASTAQHGKNHLKIRFTDTCKFAIRLRISGWYPTFETWQRSISKAHTNIVPGKKSSFRNGIKSGIKNWIKGFRKAIRENDTSSYRGLLLTGPPGTGKTLIAQAIAASEGFSFISRTLADIKGDFVGHTSSNVRKIFDLAKSMAPTILFIDEIDAILSERGGQNSDSFSDDAVAEFLARLDGICDDSNGVAVIGATNRSDIMDSAAMSRLGTRFEIGLPTEVHRKQIFETEFAIAHLGHSLDRWLGQLAQKSAGLSGRDIRTISGSIGRQLNDMKGCELVAVLSQSSEEVREQIAENSFAQFHAELKSELGRFGTFHSSSGKSELLSAELHTLDKSVQPIRPVA